MKTGVTCTDDVTKSDPFEGLRSELTIQGYLGVSVQPCCVQDRHRPLTSPRKGAKNMTTRRRRLRRASPIALPGFAGLLNSLVTVCTYRGGLTP